MANTNQNGETRHPGVSAVSLQPGQRWTLLDFDREIGVQTTWPGLEKALTDIPCTASSGNAIATLVAPSGETLSVGIAGINDLDNRDLEPPLATVEYNLASKDPPYLVVVGDPKLDFENGGVIVFRFEGQWTEILRRNCVPVETLLRIVRHFFEQGALPEWIAWEQI